MASSLSYAIYIVGANRPMLSEIPTLKMTFYVLVFGAVIFAGRFADRHALHHARRQPAADAGRRGGTGTIPHRHLLPLHHGCHPAHRLYAHRRYRERWSP